MFDGPLLRSHRFGAACVTFMLGCLEELRRSLDEHGLKLAWQIGEPIERVIQFATDLAVDKVYWNRDYKPTARAWLQWFLRGPVHEYVTDRNLPANNGTPKLSPHLRVGTISA